MLHSSALAYQMAAADGATHVGLMVLVYDAIAADLVKASKAVRDRDVELRCSRSNHALLLLGHLDSWIDLIDEPILATSMRQFYAMVRARIMQLQAAADADEFDQLADLISQTRACWQQKDKASQNFARTLIAVAQPAEAGGRPQQRLQLNA